MSARTVIAERKKMPKFLKLTDYESPHLTELVNIDEISNVEPLKETYGFFNSTVKVIGSEITMKNTAATYVAELPEQIYAMIEGVQT